MDQINCELITDFVLLVFIAVLLGQVIGRFNFGQMVRQIRENAAASKCERREADREVDVSMM